jgi:hypothetical protein
MYKAVPAFPQLDSWHKDKASRSQEGRPSSALEPAAWPPESWPQWELDLGLEVTLQLCTSNSVLLQA